ncbi:hypothetical protein EJ07DRAFT_152701 [Lizonia empirigonia]|nr:hypothetical protein EJ07DRAFT_152701 [Lizonia empirigonia]
MAAESSVFDRLRRLYNPQERAARFRLASCRISHPRESTWAVDIESVPVLRAEGAQFKGGSRPVSVRVDIDGAAIRIFCRKTSGISIASMVRPPPAVEREWGRVGEAVRSPACVSASQDATVKKGLLEKTLARREAIRGWAKE